MFALLVANAQAKVRVEVEGLEDAERANVESRLSILTQADEASKAADKAEKNDKNEKNDKSGEKTREDEARIQRLHRQAEADIREALQPFGYYSPRIISKLTQDGPDWTARYTVNAGPPTLLGEITVKFEGEGASFEPLTDRLRHVPLKTGERLMHAEYESVKKRMSDAALANGFLDAKWAASELRVNPQTRLADVNLRLETGPRFYFGEVTVQQEGLDADVIQRYVHIQPGEPFDPQALLALQFRLSDLGYFQSVQIDPQRAQADATRRVPILVTTTPRARSKYDFGMGYGTDTGARLSVGSDWRRLNHRGHTLTADFRLSEIKNTVGTTYLVPLGEEPGENLGLYTSAESQKLDAGDTLKYLIGSALNRSPGNLQQRYYLEYLHEESNFGDAFTTADLLTPGLSLSHSISDDPIYTRRGLYLFGDVHGAAKNVLSNATFAQTRLIARAHYPLTHRIRLIGRAELGYSLVDQFDELPASQRFFAGGDQSVRGYSYQSIGPKDKDGNVVGGRYLSVFSIESECRVWNNWGAAVFMDAGGADDNPGPRLFKGVGVGLRYRAPIGSLQLDLAHPMDGDESGIRLHFGVRVGV
ncbi:MAG: autotransporter assembly complex protein TamA [Panacagrimonas sp.]